MTSGRGAAIRVALLDIEGTTTPVAFVYDVLFPYARARLAAWFAARSLADPEVIEIVDCLRIEVEADGRGVPEAWTPESIVARLLAYADEDRKSRALKIVQGRIWEEGYASGTLRGEVYPDVPPALARWTAAGLAIGIFSSGSVLAQKLLFAHSNAGDLTPWLRWHFDTAVGPKIDSRSYVRIAGAIGVEPGGVLFVSDVSRELDAARDAGMNTLLAVRPPSSAPASPHRVIRTFDDVDRALGITPSFPPATPSAGSC